MIRCKTARKLLPLLDPKANDINIRKRTHLEEHLKRCRQCREYHAEQIRLQDVLTRAGGVQFPTEYLQDFTMRLNKRMDSNEKSIGWIRHWLHQLDVNPLPTLAQAAAVLWLLLIIAVQFPGVGPAMLEVIGT